MFYIEILIKEKLYLDTKQGYIKENLSRFSRIQGVKMLFFQKENDTTGRHSVELFVSPHLSLCLKFQVPA